MDGGWTLGGARAKSRPTCPQVCLPPTSRFLVGGNGEFATRLGGDMQRKGAYSFASSAHAPLRRLSPGRRRLTGKFRRNSRPRWILSSPPRSIPPRVDKGHCGSERPVCLRQFMRTLARTGGPDGSRGPTPARFRHGATEGNGGWAPSPQNSNISMDPGATPECNFARDSQRILGARSHNALRQFTGFLVGANGADRSRGPI